MGRFLRKIFILCVLLVVAAFALDLLLTPLFQQGRTVKAQWLNNIQGEHYDLAITGSSRAWWNIDVNEINDRCSIRAISMANNHFTPSEILLALKVFLSNGNTVDQILVQVDHYNMAIDQDEFSSTVYDYLPWLKDSVVYEHLRDRSMEWPLLRHVPFARYGRYNFKWGVEEALITVADVRTSLFDSTGSFFIDREFRGYPYYEVGEIEYGLNRDIREILRLCEQHGIRLQFFTAPYYRLRLPPGAGTRFHGLMQEQGLDHFDHSHRLDSTIYFDNSWHLSLHGGRAYTDILINEMICPGSADKKGPIPDVP